MEKKHLLALVLFVAGLQSLTVRGQGSLTPPGGPSPTMKTLAQVEPRTPISTLPFTISAPGSYYVTTNLTAASAGIGVTISSGNVVLDLSGFTLNGAKVGTSGIYVIGNFTNIVIRNGIVTSWTYSGVDAYASGYSRQVRMEDLNVFGNGGTGISAEADTIIRNCVVMGNTGDGIYCVGGEISDCICRTNLNYGFNLRDCTVRNCRAEYNYAAGMTIDNCRVLDCAIDYNAGGIYTISSSHNEVRRCHVCFNGGTGGVILTSKGPGYISDCMIASNEGPGLLVTGNGCVITGNDCYSNSTGGIIINGSNNRVDNNHVVTPYNVHGISIASGSFYSNNVVIRNTVGGGGANAINYDRPASGHDIGPIGTAATSTSPWANISH